MMLYLVYEIVCVVCGGWQCGMCGGVGVSVSVLWVGACVVYLFSLMFSIISTLNNTLHIMCVQGWRGSGGDGG